MSVDKTTLPSDVPYLLFTVENERKKKLSAHRLFHIGTECF